MTKLNCGCCESPHQYIAEHIDPSGTIEAGDDPAAIMARIIEMYAVTPSDGQPPITLDDVASYIRGRGIRIELPSGYSMRIIEEDWVCPECYSNVRCDCA